METTQTMPSAEVITDAFRHLGGYFFTGKELGMPDRGFVLASAPDFFYYDPVIVYFSPQRKLMEEAIQEFPGVVVTNERSMEIRFRYKDSSGQTHTKVFTGISASAVQQAIDQLNGKTIFQGKSKLKLDMAIRRAKKKTNNTYTIEQLRSFKYD